MLNKDFKEKTILLGAFGFLSMEMMEFMKSNNLSLKTILKDDKYLSVRQTVRLLQNLEIKIGNTDKEEVYLNKCIARVNNKGEKSDYIRPIVGLSMLMTYKTDYMCKRIGKGLNMKNLMNIFVFIEENNENARQYFNNSMDLADKLYKEILK